MSALSDDLPGAVRALRTRFEGEVEPLREELWRYCYRLTGSVWDAEDLVQETMQRALARLAELWQPVSTRAYLFRMASHAWIDRWRQDSRTEMVALDEEWPGHSPHPDLQVRAHEAIGHMVRVLTPLQRTVVLLCDTFSFTGPEAAALLGTSEGAVKAALHRARRELSSRAEEGRAHPSGAGDRPEEPRARLSRPAEVPALVARYVEAFDARDPDAIAALLHEHAQATVVGCAVEMGREMIRANSLAEWAADPAPQYARAGTLEGRDVVFVFTEDGRGTTRLHSVIELDAGSSRVYAQRTYYFCPEFLEHAAAALGVGAVTHGHQYPFA